MVLALPRIRVVAAVYAASSPPPPRPAPCTQQDMLDIIDLEGRREPGAPYPATQGGFDLIWANGQTVQQFDQATSLPTLLGCYNPHDHNQIRKAQQQQQNVSMQQQRRSFRKTGSSNSSGGGTQAAPAEAK